MASQPIAPESLSTTRDFEHLAAEIRRIILDVTVETSSPHLACCFSCTDILTTLYFKILRHSPEQIDDPNRDRFILSKGHSCLALYTVLNKRGFLPDDVFANYGINGGTLEHHSARDLHWGMEANTGSLGHGLPLATGLAKAAQIDGSPYRVFALLSDGELDEGTNWEAALFAAHHDLDNLVAIVDYNKIQALGNVEDVMGLDPLADKWRAFNWNVIECDGHSYEELFAALDPVPQVEGKPTIVIANTVKGKGVSFMENDLLWHYHRPNPEQLAQAREELAAQANG